MDWRFWRRFRRTESHANAERMPVWVIRAEKRSSRFSIAETCFGIIVVAGVLYEDWDNLPMIVQPNSPAGRMAIGGIIVAFGIVAEIWSSSRASKAEHEVRDWYAFRVAELNLARVKLEELLERRTVTRLLSESECETLKDNISIFKEQPFEMSVLSDHRDYFSEQFRFRDQLMELITSAGWHPFGGMLYTGAVGQGVIILFPPEGESAALALHECLTSFSIECRATPGMSSPGVPIDKIHIMVGTR